MASTEGIARFVPFDQLVIGHRYLHTSKGQLVPVTVRAVLPSNPDEPGPSSTASRGNLVGIEYDDVTLGKHSGVLEGKAVFTTRAEGAGSFIKYNDAARKGLQRGWTVVEALVERYGVDIPTASRTRQQAEGADTAGAVLANGRAIEMPGMDGVAKRMARLNRLQHAGLDGYWISSLSDHVDDGLRHYLKDNLTCRLDITMHPVWSLGGC